MSTTDITVDGEMSLEELALESVELLPDRDTMQAVNALGVQAATATIAGGAASVGAVTTVTQLNLAVQVAVD